MNPARRRALALVGTIALAAALLSCRAEAPATTSRLPVPPGDAIPADLEAMLYGSTQSCMRQADCPGGVCFYGSCLGLLIAEQRWMQEAITAELVDALAGTPELRPRVVRRLVDVLDRASTDLSFRARALIPLEALGELEPIRRALEMGDERLEAAAAMALARLGEPAGFPLTAALTEHTSPVVAAEAIRALGRSGEPAALEPLLRNLAPDLDGALSRAAVHALGELGDARAIRPLVGFLEDGPEFLSHRIVSALRRLSGARLGNDLAAWRAWVAEHAPPEPPPWRPREVGGGDDLGLPTP